VTAFDGRAVHKALLPQSSEASATLLLNRGSFKTAADGAEDLFG